MEADSVQSANETRLLKACINDLIGIQALPAIWDGGQPSQIVGTMLDVLLAILDLDFAYAQLKDSIGGAPFETVRLANDRSLMIQPQEIGRVLNPWLGDVPFRLPLLVRNPIGDGDVSIVPMRLGQRDEMGVLVAGSVRVDFPTPTERLLLNVAANQAVMALHEVRRLSEKEQLAHELDQRVAQRTRELVAVNEELRKEINDRKRAEEALRESEERFRQMADALPEVIWITALEPERVLYTSPSFERIWGLSVEDLYRNPRLRRETIHPEDRERVARTFTRWISGEPINYDVEFRIIRPNGETRWIHERGVLRRNEEGKPVGLSGISTDITESKRAQSELRRKEAYLVEAQRLSQTGSFGWDVSGGEIYWSRETFRIFEYKPTGKVTIEQVVQRTHPEDRSNVQQLIERVSREKKEFDFEHRLLMPDGSVKYLRVVGHPSKDESGCFEFVGAVMDITGPKRAEADLRRALDEIKKLRDQLYKENIALREEIDKASMFEEIVGESPALQAVLARVAKVAPTDSTVLITGETGTGKELIARAIHKRSRRSSRAFVSVNCAVIPRDLIASDLFGHEKGAFTGATQRRLGRFELAEGGTIFLDEFGELPAATQIALLRVLQEHEFERVGGTGSIRTDVRVIAATNRNLQAAISAGTFRSDLFYRLNVFPIEIPSLRERREDIPLLVEYFIDHYARKAGKSLQAVSKKSLDLLQSYPWPGNIRELQNVIERSVIVCETENFSVDESWLSRQPLAIEPNNEPAFSQRLTAQERELIEAALSESGGRVYGPSGAAAKLGMPRSTLESKIRSLQIDKNRFKT